MERILTRVALRSARPRDITRLTMSLEQLPQIQKLLCEITDENLLKIKNYCKPLPELFKFLSEAIIDNPPMTIREGGVIADGFDDD